MSEEVVKSEQAAFIDMVAQMVARRETLRLDIGLATDVGFIVRRDGRIAGAFSTCAEMCMWIENEWRQYDPILQPGQDELPNVVRMDPAAKQGGLWGRGK